MVGGTALDAKGVKLASGPKGGCERDLAVAESRGATAVKISHG